MSGSSRADLLDPERASHSAMLAFVMAEAAFIKDVAGGAIPRLVLLAGLDDQLRRDRALAGAVEAAAPAERRRLLREVLGRAAGRQRLDLLRLARLEILHRRLYDQSVDRTGAFRSDAERDAARAKYAGVYGRMIVAVALEVIDGRLGRVAIVEAVKLERWPLGVACAPWREGHHDLLDEVRAGHTHASIDEHHLALDRDDGRPDLRVVSALATTRDVASLLVDREELGGRLRVVMAEYEALRHDVSSAARARTRRLLTLMLESRRSAAAIDERLRAEGFEPIKENTIDVRWKRALAPYEELPDVLSRRRGDFDDVVWVLERLRHRSSTTGRPSTTVR